MSKSTGLRTYVNEHIPKIYPSGIGVESRKINRNHCIEEREHAVTPDKFLGSIACACCGAPAITKRRVGRSGNRMAPVCAAQYCRRIVDRADVARIDMASTNALPEIV